MNKEIKEILEKLKINQIHGLVTSITPMESFTILDCITNLEKENKELKEQIEILTSDDDNESVWLENYNI